MLDCHQPYVSNHVSSAFFQIAHRKQPSARCKSSFQARFSPHKPTHQSPSPSPSLLNHMTPISSTSRPTSLHPSSCNSRELTTNRIAHRAASLIGVARDRATSSVSNVVQQVRISGWPKTSLRVDVCESVAKYRMASRMVLRPLLDMTLVEHSVASPMLVSTTP